MRVISTYDFRNNLSDYIDEVYLDKVPLVVGRFNKPLVVIKPFKEGDDNDFMRFFGFMGKGGEGGEAYVNRIRRSAREKRRIENLRKRNV